MIKFFRWLIGFVQFSFEGGFADGFINSCYESGLAVRDLHYSGSALCACCPASQYLAFSRIAKMHGGRLRIIKKSGIVFPLLKIRNRYGLAVGALLFVVILSFFSGFIWNIEIVGNSRIKDSEIRDFLAQNGVYEGVYRDTVNTDKIENLIMASFDDCAWVHINELGTTARIEINETKNPPPRKPKKKNICNVKATDDGFIVRVALYNGKAVARVGDSVRKGDTLIKGVYTDDKEKTHRVHAEGEYIAQVTEPFELVVSRTQSRPVLTGRSEYKTLAFFGIYIPLHIGKADTQGAVCDLDSEYIRVNGKRVPVGIITTTASKYNNVPHTLTDRELAALAQSETEKKLHSEFAGAQIIRKKLDTNITADTAIVKGQITCLKNIAAESAVKVKKKK